MELPVLKPGDLKANTDYLRDIALTLSSLQRGFLPKHPKQWEYGLEVTMRGICTQTFKVEDNDRQVLLDLVKNKIRFSGQVWDLGEISSSQLFQELNEWATRHGVELERPDFENGRFDAAETHKYAATLWWLQRQFANISKDFKMGEIAPVFLYPHHFDLALVWFPYDDQRQISVGFSMGDEMVPEPYVYLTIYPEGPNFKNINVPREAQFQTDGFSGLVLLYKNLSVAENPAELLQAFIGSSASYIIANELFG